MLNLLGMHKPGADGADQSLLPNRPIGEGDEHVTAGGRCADTEIARLDRRVGGIGNYAQRPAQRRFILIERNTVLLAFLAVSLVPVEAGARVRHFGGASSCMDKCPYVQSPGASGTTCRT